MNDDRPAAVWSYVIVEEISLNVDRRTTTLAEQGLNFADAAKIFDKPVFESEATALLTRSGALSPIDCSRTN